MLNKHLDDDSNKDFDYPNCKIRGIGVWSLERINLISSKLVKDPHFSFLQENYRTNLQSAIMEYIPMM